MDVQVITAIINEAVLGLDITTEQKNILLGIYFGYFYKSILEILIGIKSEDANFYTKLNSVLLELVNTLDVDEKKVFSDQVTKEKTRILVDVLNQFKDNLDSEMKSKIENNVEGIISKVPNIAA